MVNDEAMKWLSHALVNDEAMVRSKKMALKRACEKDD